MNIRNQMKMDIMSIPENVPLARVTVAAFASQLDFTLVDLDELKVVISEAVSNSIIHGYENNPNHTVSIIATLYTNDTLEIIIEDQGKGIENVKEALQPAFSTEDDRMGMGFVFMQSFMDDLKVESQVNQGTKVTMLKKFNQNASIEEITES